MTLNSRRQRYLVKVVLALLVAGCGETASHTTVGGRDASAWIKALNDPDAKLRRQAVLKLGNVIADNPAAAEALETALKDADPLVRFDAVLAVFKDPVPRPSVLLALESMSLSDPDQKVKEAAAKALVKIKSRQ